MILWLSLKCQFIGNGRAAFYWKVSSAASNKYLNGLCRSSLAIKHIALLIVRNSFLDINGNML